MQGTTRTSRVVSRFGRMVGVAVIALGIAVGTVEMRDVAAFGGVHAVPVSLDDAEARLERFGGTAKTTTPRSGWGGGTLATRR